MQQSYESIERILSRFETRRTLRLLFSRLLAFLTVLAAALVAGASVKHLAPQHVWLPLLFAIFSLSALAFSLFFAIRPMTKRRGIDQVALTVQDGFPELGDDLINAVQLYRQFHPLKRGPGISARLASALIDRTARRLTETDLSPLLKKNNLTRGVITLVILLTAGGLLALSDPAYISYSIDLLIHPGAAAGFGRTTLNVKPGDITVLSGSAAPIEADYSRPVQVETWLLMGQNGEQAQYKMTPAENGSYKFRVEKVSKSLTYSVRSRLARAGPFQLTVVDPPMVGGLSISLVPPSYTRLAVRTEQGTGNITAYPGTEASFSISPTREIAEAALIFDDGKQLPLKKKEDETWQGSMVLLTRKSYHIMLKDASNFVDPHPINYTIEITPDNPPQIEIASPAQDLEMNEGEELPIAYVARDDFGVSATQLKYSLQGWEEKSIKITGQKGAEQVLSGQHSWQLVGPEFSHSSLITYYLEATDNDTISGPKKSVSKAYTIKIRGREEEHKKLQGKIASITEDLLWLLSDQLELQDRVSHALGSNNEALKRKVLPEGMKKKEELQDRISEIIRDVDNLIAEMTADPMSTYLTYFNLQALKKNLDYLNHTTMEKSKEALGRMTPGGNEKRASAVLQTEESSTSGLEQAVLLAEDAGKESRAADLAGISSDMLKEQSDLMDMLKRLMETGDREAAAKVMEQLAKLQEMLARLMEKLTELAQSPSEEFLNSESFQTLDLGGLQKLMQQIQDALRQGDLKKAMELAKQFMGSLSGLMAMLQEMSSMASARFQQFKGTTDTLMGELNRIIEEQKRVLAATESVHKDMTARLNELQLNKQVELTRSAQKELRKLLDAFDRRFRESVKRGNIKEKNLVRYDQLERLMKKTVEELDRGEGPGLLEALEGFISEAQEMDELLSRQAPADMRSQGQPREHQQQLSELKKFTQELQNLTPGPRHLTQEERARLKELSLKENTLRKDTDKLASFIQKLSTLLPTLLPEIADNMLEAESQMDQAAGHLYNEKTAMALPPEREALYLLKKAMDQLKEAAEQLSAAAALQGMSMPLFMGEGAPFPMPFGFMPGRGYSSGGQLGQSLQPFKIPSGEEYRVPRLLREEVLRALKEGYPSEYKEEVKKYFRSLSR